MVFEKTLVRAGRVRAFQISFAPGGWEVSERDDVKGTQRHQHADWHRVEREVMRFSRQVEELRQEGWTES